MGELIIGGLLVLIGVLTGAAISATASRRLED